MTVYELIRENYPSLYTRLSIHYPGMLETAKVVEVIPWRDEWVRGMERNPEAVVQLRQLEEMLRKGLITEEEYERKAGELVKGYISRVEGMAFIEKKQVSFRDESPSEHLVVHELGHVHYEETDLFWNWAYGGGEALVWLTLEERFRSSDEQVRLFMRMLHEVYEDHMAVAEKIVRACWMDSLGEKPSFYGLCTAAGWIPSGFSRKGHLDRPWEVEPVREDVFSFFQNLVEGLKWGDPFWVRYAERLGFVEV